MEAYGEYLKRVREQYLPAASGSAASAVAVAASSDTQHTADAVAELQSAGMRFSVPEDPSQRDAATQHREPQRAFQEERSHLLRLIEQQQDAQPQGQTKRATNVTEIRHRDENESDSYVRRSPPREQMGDHSTRRYDAGSNRLHTQPLQRSTEHHQHYVGSSNSKVTGTGSSGVGSGAPTHARYREILEEVEKLSNTITTMHQERADMELNLTQRLRDSRKEIEAKDSDIGALEMRLEEHSMQCSDLKNQLAIAKREALKHQRECETYRQQALLHTDQQHQLTQLVRDGEERERLIVAQEQCMRELEVRCDSASSAAREYEQRYLRLQQSQQHEVEGAAVRETQWKEFLSTTAGALLLLTREVEDCGARFASLSSADGAGSGRAPSQSPPSRRSLSFQTTESDDPFASGGEAAVRSLERSLELMEASMGLGPDAAHAFHKSKAHFSDAVQKQCRRFARLVAAASARLDEQRSRSTKSSVETARMEEMLGRAEASAAAAARDNAQLRRERQELVTAYEKEKHETEEMKARIMELIAEAEKREASNAQHTESLKQLIEGADLDLHRHRMRVNELEALNTRILSQKALADEEARSAIQQLRQSVSLKDSQVGRLRSELDQLRSRTLQDMSLDGHRLDDDALDNNATQDLAHRSISAQDQSTTGGGSVVGAVFLRQQNQQLAAHIDALQKRMERMKEEKDSALMAVEKQRDVIRQHQDVLDMVSKGGRDHSTNRKRGD